MGKVYVVQNTHRLNRKTSTLEPKYDLSSAEKFGELVFLVSPSAKPFEPQEVIAEMIQKLEHYNNTDHLLLVGSPALIGFACSIAASVNAGYISVLQWDGKSREYTSIKACLSLDPQERTWRDTWAG